MGQRKKDGGCIHNHRGGVIFSVVGLLFLMTLMMTLLLDRYWTQAIFTAKSVHFYEAKILKEIFLSELQQQDLSEKGSRRYNLGTLDYQLKDDGVKIDISIQGKKYTFKETKETAELE